MLLCVHTASVKTRTKGLFHRNSRVLIILVYKTIHVKTRIFSLARHRNQQAGAKQMVLPPRGLATTNILSSA